MKTETLKTLIKEEIKNILREGENEHQNYMFFQNLHTIKKMTEKMLALNPQEVDSLLSNGHAWAVDHISTSTDDITEVGTWLCNKLGQEINNTNIMSETDSSDSPAWKKSGFKSEEEHNKFLDTKMKDMMDRIKSDPKLLNVFKRLKDK
jgi:hypothetical protein